MGVSIIRDLGNKYGNLGSVLVRHLGRYFVVSGTDRWDNPEWIVVPATRSGRVTGWRDLATRDTKEAALDVLGKWDGKCHCGGDLRALDRCPVCSCELFEIDCGERLGRQS